MATEKYRATPKKAQQSRNAAQNGQRVRQNPKQTRPALSPEERRAREKKRREALRQEKEERARLLRLRRQRRARLFRLCLSVSLVLVVFYWAWVAISITTRSDGSEDALPLMIFTEGERKEDKTFSPEEVCVGEVKYLPLTELENYMAISQFGDHETRSFLICSSGEYATFYLGTTEAIINGIHVSLKEPVFLKEDVLYLPVDFFADKMNCFTYSASVAAYGADVLTYLDTEPGFLFSSCPAGESVSYATVPVAPTVPAEPTV